MLAPFSNLNTIDTSFQIAIYAIKWMEINVDGLLKQEKFSLVSSVTTHLVPIVVRYCIMISHNNSLCFFDVHMYGWSYKK